MKLRKYLREAKWKNTDIYGDIYISDVEVRAVEVEKGKYSVLTTKTQHGMAEYNQWSRSKKRKPISKAEVMKWVKSLQKEMKNPKELKLNWM